MKGRYKLWLGIAAIGLIAGGLQVDWHCIDIHPNLKDETLSFSCAAGSIVLTTLFYIPAALFFIAQIIGLLIIIGLVKYTNKQNKFVNIYEMEADEIISNKWEYSIIPVVTVVVVKFINRWADSKL